MTSLYKKYKFKGCDIKMRIVETATKEEIGKPIIKAKLSWTTEEVQNTLDKVYFEYCDEHLDDSYRDINAKTDKKLDGSIKMKFNPYDLAQLNQHSGIDKTQLRSILMNAFDRQ